MRLKLYAVVLSWVPVLASAGTNTWTAMGPAGANVQTMVFGKPSGTVFAAGSTGVYRSLDDGADWQAVKTDFPGNAPSGMAIDPSDATRLYVVAPTAPSLYVSTDGGTTLQASTSLPTSVAAGQVGVSQDGQTLYIASAGQIFVSTDRGVTWTQRTAITSDPVAIPLGLIVDPTDANTVYVSIQLTTALLEQVQATHDGGMTWQVLNSYAISNGGTPSLAINPANPMQLWLARYDGLLTSLDRGVTWTNVLSAGPMLAVAVDPENSASVFGADFDGIVYHSIDSGGQWAGATGSTSTGAVTSIAVDPAQSNRILEAGLSGVAGSSDAGSTWSAQEGGLLASNVAALSADPAADLIYATVSSEGVYSATTGASSFLPVNNPGLFTLQYSALVPGTTIDVSALLAQPGALLASLPDGLATSRDGGNSWTLSTVVPPDNGSQQLFLIASSSATPQTILAATYSSIYQTGNGGGLWNLGGNGLPANSSIAKLLVAPSNGQVAYSLVSGPAIYRSSDAGLDWTATTAGPVLLLAVDPTSPATVYGATDAALLKSTDSGGTWSTVPYDDSLTGGAPDMLAVDPLHPQILIASRAAGVARSVDGGATWEGLQPGTPSGWGITSLLLDPLHPESLLVGTYNRGAQQITIAPDLSLTGTASPNPVAIGAPVTFALTVANLGPFAATDVTVNVPLPAMTQTSTATATGATCISAGSDATCQFPVLRSGASAAVTVTANGVAAGPVQVVGTVTADQPDANPQNNSVTLATAVAAVADLSVTVTGNATAQIGDSLTYAITVSNAGPNTATSSTLAFQVAGGLTPGTITTAAGTCSINSAALVTCALGDLAAQGSVKVSVGATAADAGSQVSTAQVSSAAVDPVAANNTATVSTAATAPAATTATSTGSSGGAGSSVGAGGGGGGLSLWELLVLSGIVGCVRWRQMRHESRPAMCHVDGKAATANPIRQRHLRRQIRRCDQDAPAQRPPRD